MDRRTVLSGLAATIAGSGAIGCARAEQVGVLLPDDRPFAPWAAAEHLAAGDPKSLVSAAILSPNPHNTQPWRFAIESDRISIEADPRRHLGSFDPFRREMWIGLGAAIETMAIVAPGLGFRLSEPVLSGLAAGGAGRATMRLASAPITPHPLAPFVARRRTNRAPYATTPLPANLTLAIAGATEGSARIRLFASNAAAGLGFARATVAATARINSDPAMPGDSHRWFRPNARAIALHRDGVSVATAGLSPTMAFLGQIMPPVDSETAGRYWLASTERAVTNSAGFGVIVVDDLDDRAGQIEAGRLWQRVQLMMTAAGIASQPLNQLPELVDRDRQLGLDRGWSRRLGEIAGAGGVATFAFRYGLPTRDVPQSARRSLQDVIA